VEAAVQIQTLEEFEATARRVLGREGLAYVVAKIEMTRGRFPSGGGPNRYEQATRFIRHIEASEGVHILGNV
jgi:hypothetical protein